MADLLTSGIEYCDHGNFNGWMDEVQIYNRALNAAEVRQLYESYQDASNDVFPVTDTLRRSTASRIQIGQAKPTFNGYVVDTSHDVSTARNGV